MNQTIGVNITPQSFQPTLHYSQGDVGRVFVINVTDYDIPTGATVTCVATKPSGMGFTVSGTVSGNSVTFTSTAEMTDEWGRFPAEIRIASGNTLLGTANFLMIGEKDPHPASTIDGTQEELIPQLTLLVNRVEAAAESVHDLTVSATTLTAGSDATATYDSTNNSIAFGIPRGADGDVTRSEFNDLKSELNDLDGTLFVEKTVSGTELEINSNLAKEAKITSESATVINHTGRNLLATPYYQDSRTVNGITFTLLEDGRIHAQGTATSQAVYWIVDNGTSNRRPIKAGAYTFCGNRSVEYPSGTAWATMGITSPASEKSSVVNTFTLSADTTFYLKLTVQSGKTVDCYFAPMIESGASASEWEPYKGESITLENGQASFEMYDGYNSFSSDSTFDVTYYSGSAITKEALDLSMFGAVGDGVTDDTNAINQALESAEGKTLYIPSGTYLFSGTLHIKSGTRVIGCGDSSKFKLASTYSLDSYEWRSDTGGYYQYRYPMIATDADSNGCILENFALEGQTNAFKDENEDGICVRGSQHIVRNVSVTKVNYFPSAFSRRTCITPCWGIMTFDATNVLIQNCYAHECGYEGFGVESSTDVTIDGCLCGDANQTGIQIHRSSERIRIINCTVNYVNGTNSSALTFDADPSTPMECITVDNCYVCGVLNFVAGGENHISITNSTIVNGVNCNNQVYRTGLFLRGCKIDGRVGTYADECVMTDNIINISSGYYMIIHRGNLSVIQNNLGIGSVTDVSVNTH